jgi:hypothetical protein
MLRTSRNSSIFDATKTRRRRPSAVSESRPSGTELGLGLGRSTIGSGGAIASSGGGVETDTTGSTVCDSMRCGSATGCSCDRLFCGLRFRRLRFRGLRFVSGSGACTSRVCTSRACGSRACGSRAGGSRAGGSRAGGSRACGSAVGCSPVCSSMNDVGDSAPSGCGSSSVDKSSVDAAQGGTSPEAGAIEESATLPSWRDANVRSIGASVVAPIAPSRAASVTRYCVERLSVTGEGRTLSSLARRSSRERVRRALRLSRRTYAAKTLATVRLRKMRARVSVANAGSYGGDGPCRHFDDTR